MKKVILIFVTVMLISCITSGQINIAGSNGADGSYASLTNTGGAFEALNGTVQGGANILITIIDDVANESGSNSLNANEWSVVTINPIGVRIISGSVVGLLIHLNGADYVTIDGLNDGSNSLTISNTGLGASSTVRFSGDATYNTITNCTILGSGTVSFGVVSFGSGASTGNDYNTVSFCNIGPAGANLPLNGIYSMGSSTTIDNSNITIERNNIYDFFNAGSPTYGMNINSYNSNWTITTNSIYQTAARTYTTANSHYGIFVISGSGYYVVDNKIGGQTPNAGGGAYTMSGSVASRFWGIYLTVGTDPVSSIQGNTITNFNMSSTAANNFFNGIILTGGNANIGTDAGNTIGSGSVTGAITVTAATTAGQAIGIFASSTGTYNISNNTIGGITVYGSSVAVSANIQGIYLGAGNPTVFRNLIGSNTVANSLYAATASTSATGQYVIGINVTSSITVANTISNNTIANLTQAGTTSAHYIRGISYSGTGAGTITNNIIHDIRGATAHTTQAGGGTAVQGIIYTGASPNAIIKNNTFYSIYATNTGAVATTACAIGYSNPFAGTISENIIYDIRNASTGVAGTTPPCAVGILIRALQGPTTFANNMISLGEGQTTNTQFAGFMNSFTAGQLNAYYNSVYIAGSASTGALPSFCFYRGNNSATPITTPVDIRNNIFINNRNGGTGKHYAISNNYGATASATGWGANASNYNVLNGNASTIGYWSADQTFAGWKTASACDLNSVSGITVSFANTAVANLHLNMGLSPTQLESGGQVIASVTTDIDGDTRPGPIPSYNGGGDAPDLGADEFDGVPLDLSGPVIAYSPLLNTNLTTARTLVATITDPSGVPTGAPGWPILYWKKTGALSYIAVTPFLVEGSNYSYSFGTGVAIGDVVSYYIVAQDNSTPPNGSAYPLGASGYSFNPPAVTVPPPAPSSYSVLTPLVGDYTVGLADFNMLAGKNISFKKEIKKVMKEVWVLDPVAKQKKSSVTKTNLNVILPDALQTGTYATDGNDATTAPRRLKGSYQLLEVEEVHWVPVENGVPYEGPLFTGSISNPGFSPDATYAGAYATITAAITDLNARGVSGPVRFLLTDPTYSAGETFPIIVNVMNINAPTSSNTVILKPNTGITASVSGASASAEIFRIYKTSYFTIDGSNTTSGSTRDLTITNTSTTAPETIDILSNGTTPIIGCGVKNCNLINGANTGIGVFVGDISGNAGYFNNLTIQNNSIQTAAYGIYCSAVSATGNGSGLNINGNDLNTAGTGSIRVIGIYAQGVDGVTVTNNNVGNIANTTESSNLTGIWMASSTISATVSGNDISNISGTLTSPRGIVLSPNLAVSNSIVTDNTISGLTSSSTITTYGLWLFTATSNITVEKNTISNIKNTNTGGYGCNGIDLSSTATAANITVANNVIYDVAGYGWNSFGVTENGYGIVVESGAGYKIYYNSIYLNTNQNQAGLPAAIFISSGVTAANAIDLRDNIFANSQTVGTEKYAIYSSASNTVYSNIDFNIYYTTGANLGFLGVNAPDLAAWRTATGKDVSSIFANPGFQTSRLELTGGYSPAVGAGTSLAAVTDDYNSAPRDANYPTIGAYEYPITSTWTAGSSTSAWYTAGNWGSPTIPNIHMAVTIPTAPAGGLIFPVITSGETAECKTINIQTGASATVQTGGTLTVLLP